MRTTIPFQPSLAPHLYRVAAITVVLLTGLLTGQWLATLQQPLTRQAVAQSLLNQHREADAAYVFEDPVWSGIAHYRAGNFQRAASQFAQSSETISRYNMAGALARLNSYDDAITLYQQILREQPDHSDARYNLDLVRKAARLQQQRTTEETAPGPQPGLEPGQQEPPKSDSTRDIIQTISDDNVPPRDAEGAQQGDPQATLNDAHLQEGGEFDGGDSTEVIEPQATNATATGTVNSPLDEELEDHTEGKATATSLEKISAEVAMAEEILLRQIRDDAAMVLQARLRTAYESRKQ